MCNRVFTLCVVAALTVLTAATGADERIDYEVNAKIRKEGRERSQLMRTLHFLTDVYGPRLTGSPNHKAAAEWAVRQMKEWGFENTHLEPWEFGHPGWLNERFAGFIVAPVRDSLVGEVLAWTPSTNGTVTGRAVRIEPPRCTPAGGTAPGAPPVAGPPQQTTPEACPSQDELTAYFESVKDRVKGRMVLVGEHTKVRVTFDPPALRRDEAQLRRQFGPDAAPAVSQADTPPRRGDGRLTANQIAEQIDQFLLANGALVRLNDAGRDHGQIRAFQNRTYDPAKAVPTVILRNEDYGRISRILDDGMPVELEFTIVNVV